MNKSKSGQRRSFKLFFLSPIIWTRDLIITNYNLFKNLFLSNDKKNFLSKSFSNKEHKTFRNRSIQKVKKDFGFFYKIKAVCFNYSNLTRLGKLFLLELFLIALFFTTIFGYILNFVYYLLIKQEIFKFSGEIDNFVSSYIKEKKIAIFYMKIFILLIFFIEAVSYFYNSVLLLIDDLEKKELNIKALNLYSIQFNIIRTYRGICKQLLKWWGMSNVFFGFMFLLMAYLWQYDFNNNKRNIFYELKNILFSHITLFFSNSFLSLKPLIYLMALIGSLFFFAYIYMLNTLKINKTKIFKKNNKNNGKNIGFSAAFDSIDFSSNKSMVPWIISLFFGIMLGNSIIEFITEDRIILAFSSILPKPKLFILENAQANFVVWNFFEVYLNYFSIIFKLDITFLKYYKIMFLMGIFSLLVFVTKISDILLDTHIDLKETKTYSNTLASKELEWLEKLGDIYSDQTMILTCLGIIIGIFKKNVGDFMLILIWTVLSSFIVGVYRILKQRLFVYHINKENDENKKFEYYSPFLVSNLKEILGIITIMFCLSWTDILKIFDWLEQKQSSISEFAGIKSSIIRLVFLNLLNPVIFFVIFSLFLYLNQSITSVSSSDNYIKSIKKSLFLIKNRFNINLSWLINQLLFFSILFLSYRYNIRTENCKLVPICAILIVEAKNAYNAALYDFSFDTMMYKDKNIDDRIDYLGNFSMYKTKLCFITFISMLILKTDVITNMTEYSTSWAVFRDIIKFILVLLLLVIGIFNYVLFVLENDDILTYKIMFVNQYIHHFIFEKAKKFLFWLITLLSIVFSIITPGDKNLNLILITLLLNLALSFSYLGALRDNIKFKVKRLSNNKNSIARIRTIQDDFIGDVEKDILYNISILFASMLFLMIV